MEDFSLKGFKGLPPKDGDLYLVQEVNTNWVLCSWWTSTEIYEACGRRGKGRYLDREGFRVEGITCYVKLNKE